MARPLNIKRADPKLPAEQTDYLAQVDSILALAPIPHPKPWSDEVERAAVWHMTRASTPINALCAAGASKGAATAWMSDEPPPSYQSACIALSERLKSAHEVCSQTLLGRIYAASDDPKHWTAAAWIMERSRGYVVKQDALSGPATVVNIGQLVIQAAPGQSLPNRQLVVDAEVISEGESVPTQANLSRIPNETEQDR